LTFNWSNDNGYSSITVLFTLLLLSTLFISAAFMASKMNRQVAQNREVLEIDILMENTCREVMQLLSSDPTPESHSSNDPVWKYITDFNHPFYSLELTDISSRLNINWMRMKVFEETQLKNLIISGESADQLQQKRSLLGFSNDLRVDWQDSFGEENLSQYFTLYSWANINVSYEESLEGLYKQRAGESGATAFRLRIQQGLREFKLWNLEELPEIMGIQSGKLYPVMNVQPLMNIHFIDPFLLQCLLSYPYREEPIDQFQAKTDQLLQLREQREITPGDLEAIIDPNEKQLRVLQYIGCTTGFWSLTLKKEEQTIKQSIIWFDGEQWGRLTG